MDAFVQKVWAGCRAFLGAEGVLGVSGVPSFSELRVCGRREDVDDGFSVHVQESGH